MTGSCPSYLSSRFSRPVRYSACCCHDSCSASAGAGRTGELRAGVVEMEREVEVVEMRSEAEKGKRAVMAVRILVLVMLVVLVALVVLAVVVSLAELAVVVVPVVVVAMAVTMVATMVATTVTAATAATVMVVAAQGEAQGCRQPVSTPFDDKVLGSYAFVLVRHRYHVQPKILNNKNEKEST